MEQIVEAVPNFSEGQDLAVVDQIARAAAGVPGCGLLDRTSDADHHRTVLTLAGEPEAVLEAAVRAAGEAARLIDLTRHHGEHPRMGACDVLPFVPVRGADLAFCAALAHRAGREIWHRFQVPVFFYGAAALSADRVALEDVRRGGFERSQAAPDIGTGRHATAGASIVGARKFLIAYNINLASADIGVARAIARKIRASSGGLPCVKALGLMLGTRNQAQVSMNLTDFEVTSIDQVFSAVEEEARNLGSAADSSELIGLIPRAAVPSIDVRWENFDPSKILESRLTGALGLAPGIV
jgi:glutamate formiminotransferase